MESGWAIYPKVDQSHHIVLELEQEFDVIPGGKLAITLKQLHPPKHIIGRFKLSATDAEDASARPFPTDVTNLPDALLSPTGLHTPRTLSPGALSSIGFGTTTSDKA